MKLSLNVGCAVAFSPPREFLGEGWSLRSHFFELVFEFLPDPGYSEENSWTNEFEGLDQSSLESVGSGEVELTFIEEVTAHIQLHASYVREGQIRYDPIVGSTEAWLVPLDKEEHLGTTPSEIVVAQHAALWISSCATGVDEAAALAWNLPIRTLLDFLIFDIGAKLQEISPEEILRPLELLW